jgi:site-specific DNA-methyltransferase (adenine-specific)
MNQLYYGDNLRVLREKIKDESVDLIYLDPPFNSKRAYNVIFKDKTGKDAAAQIQAFEDTWQWPGEPQERYEEIMTGKYPAALKSVMKAFKEFLKTTDLMAYLAMMAIRLVEMYRVMKDTGSIYLHCDPTASHYLKILMDQIFGVENFLSELVWCYSERELSKKYWNHKHDILLFYSKNCRSKRVFNWKEAASEYSNGSIRKYNLIDEDGRRYQIRGRNIRGSKYIKQHGLPKWVEERNPELVYRDYLDEKEGIPPRDWIDDIPVLNRAAKERLGYPTQKPQDLLERIIAVSSNPGDLVMDPFCGCGTAVLAAEKLERKWIGIDVTILAIQLVEWRLHKNFPNAQYERIGLPKSPDEARALAKDDRFLFEAWAVTLLGGQPFKSEGGGDTGIDGLLYFKDFKGELHKIIIEVKSGGYQPKDIRALGRVLEREEAPLGIVIAINPPTPGMLSEAADLGKWKMPHSRKEYPRLQIITIDDFYAKKYPDLPDTSETWKRAKRELRESEKPPKLPKLKM